MTEHDFAAPGAHETPSVSLIVCTTGRADRMAELAARLEGVLALGGAVDEVVVVDNSAAGGIAMPTHAGLRVVRSTLPGLSRSRTVGCLLARGDVLVFTDDDVEFAPEWPERMAEPILAGEWDVSASAVRLGPEFDDVDAPIVRGWLAEANLGDAEPVLVGAGMAIRRDLLGAGCWDPSLGAGTPLGFGEETLFQRMVAARGARAGVPAGAEVVHHPDRARLDPDQLRRTAEQKGRSGAYIAYHWNGETMARPRLRSLRRALRLWLHRRRRDKGRRWFERELGLIESQASAAGFAQESRRPRAYGARGLRS